MKSARLWLIYGALVAVALALGLANQSTPKPSLVPSVDNPGAAGLKALYLLLQERGFNVRRVDSRFASSPSGVRTLVLTAPTEREIDRDEVEILRAFVEGGGRLVYLAPRLFDRAQLAMTRWLQLAPDGTLRPEEITAQLADSGGAEVKVWTPPRGAPDVRTLRVGAGVGIASSRPEAIPAAGQPGGAAALTWPEGKGEVWVFAGAEIAENRRLDVADNLALWTGFAADGPIAFDDFHHTHPTSSGVPPAVFTVAAQLAFATLAYALSRGIRLGPPRLEPVERHRSVLEYVASMAWLTRRARVEPALVEALLTHLRHVMNERAGISLTAPDAEAALQVELRAQIPRDRTQAALSALRDAASAPRLSPRQYLRCSRLAAELERALGVR